MRWRRWCAALRGERGAARVWVEEEVVRRGVWGGSLKGGAPPLPSPPYIGGRLGLGQGAGRPPLLAPPKLESI